MKVLTLSIKRNFFDEILAGTKAHEYREIRPNNAKRYFRYELKGVLYENAEDIPPLPEGADPNAEEEAWSLVPVKYDAIKFLTGAYVGKRPWALVEVKDAEIVLFCDENGDDIVYEYNGQEYVAAEIDYTLGKVIDKDLDPQ